MTILADATGVLIVTAVDLTLRSFLPGQQVLREAEEFEDEQVSELPLIGATLERANAFSTLLRYETTIDRMRRKLLNDLRGLQSHRQRRSRDRVASVNLATEERTNEDDATAP